MASPILCTCKRINDPWRSFCGACGRKLEPACKCGFVNMKADKYCGGCGCSIAPDVMPSVPPPRAVVKARPPPPPPKQGTVPIEMVHGAIMSETPT